MATTLTQTRRKHYPFWASAPMHLLPHHILNFKEPHPTTKIQGLVLYDCYYYITAILYSHPHGNKNLGSWVGIEGGKKQRRRSGLQSVCMLEELILET
jgi:hypothetical protein